MINARLETLATKPAFRAAFARRRCIVPADGFYEWQRLPGTRRKQPYFVHAADGEPLAFAGLWETWRPRVVPAGEPGAGATDEPPTLFTTTIVTTGPNATMAPVHNRMPVILPASAWETWLDPSVSDPELLTALCRPAPEGLLVLRPVGPAVGDVRNRGPSLVEPVGPDGLVATGDDPAGSVSR
jgi:putative SOS response-associated peptidase YedK